jgi:hypothetical protein
VLAGIGQQSQCTHKSRQRNLAADSHDPSCSHSEGWAANKSPEFDQLDRRMDEQEAIDFLSLCESAFRGKNRSTVSG